MSKRQHSFRRAPDIAATQRALSDFDARDPLGRHDDRRTLVARRLLRLDPVQPGPAVAPKVCPVCKLGWDRHIL